MKMFGEIDREIDAEREVERLKNRMKLLEGTNKTLVQTVYRLAQENEDLKNGIDPLEKQVRAVYDLLNAWIEEPYTDSEETDKLKFSRDVVLLVKKELGIK